MSTHDKVGIVNFSLYVEQGVPRIAIRYADDQEEDRPATELEEHLLIPSAERAHVHRCMSCGESWFCPHPPADCKAGENAFPSLTLRGPNGPHGVPSRLSGEKMKIEGEVGDLISRLMVYSTQPGPAEHRSAMAMAAEKLSLLSSERAQLIHEHDCPTAWKFFNKHGLGDKLCPSCLLCGKVEEDRDRWAIQHMELPNIYICKGCVDAARTIHSASEGQKEKP